MRRLVPPRFGMLLAGWVLVACTDSDAALTSNLTREELLDPRTCRSCHPGQYEEWSGSMHAYAAEDPVFLAMNARGQAETDGRLGSFCVNCHAPLAVREGLTEDGLDLAELPEEMRGVTCYFCHNTLDVAGTHNNPLVLANDRTMRGPFEDAAANAAHASAYDPHFDGARPEASTLCGACHDVTLPEPLVGAEVPLERTFVEWQASLFAAPHDQGGVGCSGCHMPKSPRRERAAESPGAPRRRSARHDFEGIDQALTPFPERERQQILVERLVASSLLAEICVAETGAIEVTLENSGSGHHWPSGASHNRRAWLELEAFVEGQKEPVFVTPPPTDEAGQGLVLQDRAVDADGNPAHMFWDIVEVASSTTLPSVKTRDSRHPDFHRERRVYTFNERPVSIQTIVRVTLTVKLRPIAIEVLDELVASKHLDRAVADAMPVIAVLPDRCYDASLIERHPDLLGARPVCSDAADDAGYTLLWETGRANDTEPSFRATRVDGAPARCLSHPSYVATPAP
ncbi:MAG TPA: multiheme c-type cytochrome [Polyangiaceae bacterium]|nr:multiheme c-type cytochrome [Polyangiaceae bacterium]